MGGSSPWKHSNDPPTDTQPWSPRRAVPTIRGARTQASGDPLAATRLRDQIEADSLDTRSSGRLRLLSELLGPAPQALPALLPRPSNSSTSQTRCLPKVTPSLALRIAPWPPMQTWVTDVGQGLRSLALATAERVTPSRNDPLLLSIYSLTDPEGHNMILINRAESIVPHDTDARTAHLVGAALNLAGAFGVSAPFLASAATKYRVEGRLNQLVEVLAQQAWSAFPPLDWAVATPSADESIRLAQETGQPVWQASALIVQAILAGVRGDFTLAESQTAAAEAIALPMGANALLCGIQLTRGLTALGAGRYYEAFDQLHRLFDPKDPSYHHFQSAWALGDLAEAALHTDNIEAARAQLETAELHAHIGESTWTQVSLLYAKTLLADGDAEAMFRAALRADLSMWPLYRARLLLNYGYWLRRQRRAADSRAPLRSAREAFDALGARAFAEQARTELRAAGERSHGAETRAWQELSPQELHIAPPGGGGAVQPGDRCAPLPLAPHRRLAPLPGLPQARHHVPGPTPSRPGSVALTLAWRHKRDEPEARRRREIGSCPGSRCRYSDGSQMTRAGRITSPFPSRVLRGLDARHGARLARSVHLRERFRFPPEVIWSPCGGT